VQLKEKAARLEVDFGDESWLVLHGCILSQLVQGCCRQRRLDGMLAFSCDDAKDRVATAQAAIRMLEDVLAFSAFQHAQSKSLISSAASCKTAPVLFKALGLNPLQTSQLLTSCSVWTDCLSFAHLVNRFAKQLLAWNLNADICKRAHALQELLQPWLTAAQLPISSKTPSLHTMAQELRESLGAVEMELERFRVAASLSPVSAASASADDASYLAPTAAASSTSDATSLSRACARRSFRSKKFDVSSDDARAAHAAIAEQQQRLALEIAQGEAINATLRAEIAQRKVSLVTQAVSILDAREQIKLQRQSEEAERQAEAAKRLREDQERRSRMCPARVHHIGQYCHVVKRIWDGVG